MIQDPSVAQDVSARLMSIKLDSDQWVNPTVTMLPKSGSELKDITFILSHTAYPIFSKGVREVLESTMSITDDWLDVQDSGHQYSLLNLQNEVDAIDPANATIRILPSGRVQKIPVFAFIPEMLESQWLFKVSTHPYDVLCTDQFVDAVTEHGWSGFHAQPVWDSEVKPFPWGPTTREVAQRPEVFGPNGFVTGFEDAWPDDWR